MAFTIPNLVDAGFAAQAQVDKVDVDILVAAHNGNRVISGCAVTAQGLPDMTVAVASGSILVNSVTVAVSSGNVTITAANGTNPRFDLIVVDNTGTKSATAGTAAANPVFPSIPANSVVLAAVYVPANDTDIDANQIIDKRVIGTHFGEGSIEFIMDGGGAVITTGVKGFIELPFAGTFTGWTIIGDQSGSIVVDVWKDTYANAPPTVADTITGTEKPTLASAQKNQDNALSSWTTTFAQGDILGFNVDSATTVQRVLVSLRYNRT